jgi:hypothetical protein
MEGRDARAGAVGKTCNRTLFARRRFCVAEGVRRQRIAEFSNNFSSAPVGISFASDDAMLRRARMTIAALSRRIDARFKRADKRTEARFDTVDARFEAVDRRFDAIDARFGSMEAAIERRFAQTDRKVESLGEKLDRIAGILDNKCRHQQQALDEHEDRIKDIERAARG